MRDERRIVVVEEDGKSGAGVGGIFGTVIFAVMALALVDRGLTLAWATVASWFN